MSRILVTGGAGFLGRHLCRLIHARGDEPVSLDLRAQEDAPWYSVIGSVIDPKSWETVGRVDGVIHTAALTDLWQKKPSAYDQINRGGAEMAALFAKEQGARLVLVSSYTVLMGRGIRGEQVIDGVSLPPPLDLIGPYPKSKRAAEQGVLSAHSETVIVRPTALIGPGDHRLTPPMRMTRDIAAGSLPGVMRGRINLVDVEDVAAATLAALVAGDAGASYLLSGHDYQLKDYADLVASLAHIDPPGLEVPPVVAQLAAQAETFTARFTGQRPQAVPSGVTLASLPVRFDARAAREVLGFEARPTEESVGRALEFLRQEGLLEG
ncbi:NAD-dependent epimerase/dehydratase family protein [Parvularcula sp. ZS-1/3]|uniref:NAD-dependent epimerase/dehydratase family protein n=1 Tax=Parvularcula mediterranea TaxID=2732508 RepID=A0A7Y3RKJ6_9PROT|nr:NAD-dependent epimerase/dehydratase family protein [Parvularcula mediterranea]